MGVAMRRAAHQLIDVPQVLNDPLAVSVLGAEGQSKLEGSLADHHGRFSRALRAFVVARSRFAEDELARAVQRGVAQYVVLGAGLDTFAYRHASPAPALRVFEVDHPATQAWKRTRLAAAGVVIPPSLTFVPIDFERQTLNDGLSLTSFDWRAPAFFSWLGVTMYLTEEAFLSVVRLIADTPPGGGLVFDYALSRSLLGPVGQLAFDAMSQRVEQAGEPFQTAFDPRDLRALLSRTGFVAIQDLGREELNRRYFDGRSDGLNVSGELGRMMSVEVGG